MLVTFITGNEHKVKEARDIFEKFGIEVNHENPGYPEVQGSIEEEAAYGAKYVAEKLQKPIIVDDTGLFIRALNGFPGTYSSYVQETLTNKGIIKLLKDEQDRYAEFRSCIGYCAPKCEPKTFLGTVAGEILSEERGNNGFAYDPLFYVKEYNKTFGELTTGEKDECSHRRKSMEKFAKWYSEQWTFTSKTLLYYLKQKIGKTFF